MPAMQGLILFFIRFYQLALSPLSPPSCRFIPSCSAYAAEALQTHGIAYGGYLTARRILRCSPLSKGGYDPVPQLRTKQHTNRLQKS
jgi:hypothetical protein